MSELWVRTIERYGETDYYITAAADPSGPAPDTAEELLGRIAGQLRDHDIATIQEKLYGSRSCRDRVLTLRERVWKSAGLDLTVPATWIEGAPPWGVGFAGFQLWGIAVDGGAAHTVRSVPGAGRAPARLWEGPDFRMLFVPQVFGLREGGERAATVTQQAREMFRRATLALEANGFDYRQVTRTWIYLSRLLDWYGEFNRVRTGHHARLDQIANVRTAVFPASTGIQGRSDDEECFLELLAVAAAPGGGEGGVRIEPILNTSRQDRAFAYGSAFSRGMSLRWGGRTTVHVSGTASIDTSGASVHLGHRDAQVLETLCSVAAVLETQTAKLSDILTATVFCKGPEDFEAYRRVSRQLGLSPLPGVPVLADVCRPELLFEVEVVAAGGPSVPA